ncbi:transposase [Spirosoma sp. LMG 31447]|uniref:Transposase n=1 Tax=Spirosoma utsteinense TaxID=2585773 RepID=A0ABR6WEM0_9BACT|nr:transposase [Spirosoma utsteinense]
MKKYAYSPELNPMELLWIDLRWSLKNKIFTALGHLLEAVLD